MHGVLDTFVGCFGSSPNFALLVFYGFDLNISVCFKKVLEKGKVCRDRLETHAYNKQKICHGHQDCGIKGRKLCAWDPNCYGFMVRKIPTNNKPITGIIPCVSKRLEDLPDTLDAMSISFKCENNANLPYQPHGKYHR